MWVGLDLGTSGLKAVVIDQQGRVVARAQHAYATERPEPGASEQNPAHWVTAASTALRSLAAQTDSSSWQGIGLSAMLPTLVALDADRSPLGPAITWEDARADAEGEALREACGDHELYRLTGQWVDGRYLLPMLARRCATDEGLRQRVTSIAGAKDVLVAWLTGELLTDPSTAAGFGCFDLARGSWDDAVRARAATLSGVRPDLPEVVEATAHRPLLASVAAELRLPAGVPVVVGAADSVLGALGLGITEPGQVAYVAGTSTIILGIAATAEPDDQHRYLITPLAQPGHFGLEMDLLATGSAIRWLTGLLGLPDEGALLALASTADPTSTPAFLPYVAPGEQGALWDPDLTGTLTGLGLSHGRADIARALIDGILLESRRCLRVLDEHGFPPGPIVAAGGSSVDPWFRQQLADACGRTVIAAGSDDPDRSALGAALLARSSVGGESHPEVSPPASHDTVEHHPDVTTTERWAEVAARHESMLNALRSRHDMSKPLDAR